MRDSARRVRADGFEDVLNGHISTGIAPWRDRAAIEHKARHVRPRERHDGTGNRLVAADERNDAVELVAVDDHLDGVGNDLATHEGHAHAERSHRDAVRDRDGVELQRCAAGRQNALADVHGQLAEVVVAGTDLDPGVGDPDERLAEVAVGQPVGFQHGAGGRAVRALHEGGAAMLWGLLV